MPRSCDDFKSVAPTQNYIKSKIQITVYFFPFVVVVVLEMISALFFPFLIHNNYKNTIFYLTVVFFIYVSPHKYYKNILLDNSITNFSLHRFFQLATQLELQENLFYLQAFALLFFFPFFFPNLTLLQKLTTVSKETSLIT